MFQLLVHTEAIKNTEFLITHLTGMYLNTISANTDFHASSSSHAVKGTNSATSVRTLRLEKGGKKFPDCANSRSPGRKLQEKILISISSIAAMFLIFHKHKSSYRIHTWYTLRDISTLKKKRMH
jgi:hypothetical protein